MRYFTSVCFLLTAMVTGAQSPDSIWQQGLKNFDQQNFHGVIEDMNNLLSIAPLYPNAFYNRGIAYMNLGDMESACADLNNALSLGVDENKKMIGYLCDPDVVRNLLLEQYYKKETVYPELGYRPRYTHADTLRGSLRAERTCFDVYFYDLRVKIIPKGKKIEGNNDIYFQVMQPTQRIQVDLFSNYEVTSVLWNGIGVAWNRDGNAIFIEFPEELSAGEMQVVSISYRGKPVIAPNPPWDGGFVWNHDKNKDLWLGVACEHLGASSWWPTKDHMTDKPDSMQITLDIPRGYQAVSNGNLRNSETVDKKTDRFTWFVHYPINNYNVTFYVGKYTAFNDTLVQGTDTLRLDYNVLTYNLDTAREHFRQTRDVLSFYNEAFGFYPFPGDGFGLVESSYEGMEHQSAIAYGHGYKHNNSQDYRNQLYDYIIVHEAAHEWWGNSVTACDMADIWIHEGFATYAEYLFLEHRLGKEEYMYELADKSRYIFNVWPLVQNRGVNENTFASNDVYNKGAMLLHCLRCSINNDSLFFGMLRDFCIQYRYKTVNSDDFIRFVNEYTGSDYTAFFKKYLHETTLPVLTYTCAVENGDLVIHYRWNGVEEGFVMPFGIETNRKESIRLVANTRWQEIRIPGAEWFNFYNLWKGYSGSPENSFTYFNTHREKASVNQ
jgi:aminopeptidase N